MPKRRTTHIMLALLCMMYFIAFVDRVNISIASTAFGPEFGLSNTEIGMVISAFALPYLLFQVIGGVAGDRFGPRWTLAVSVLVMAGATIAIGLVGGFVSMLAARIVLGMGEGATFPVATNAVSRWIRRDRRGAAQGLTHAAARLGNAVCPPIIAVLMTATSWRGSFFVVGAVTLAWAAVWVLYFRDDPHSHPAITAEELEGLELPSQPVRLSAVPVGRLALRMLPITLVYFCYGWTLWLYLGWMPQYFLHNFGLALGRSALFASAVFFAGVVGDVAGGALTDRLLRRTGNIVTARRNLVIVGLFGALACLVPMMYAQDLVLCTVLLAGGLFFCEMTIGPMWSLPMDVAPSYSGTATGLMCVGGSLGAFFSPVVTGFLIDQTGSWRAPFVCPISLLIFGIVVAFWMRPERPFAGPDAAVAAADRFRVAA